MWITLKVGEPVSPVESYQQRCEYLSTFHAFFIFPELAKYKSQEK